MTQPQTPPRAPARPLENVVTTGFSAVFAAYMGKLALAYVPVLAEPAPQLFEATVVAFVAGALALAASAIRSNPVVARALGLMSAALAVGTTRSGSSTMEARIRASWIPLSHSTPARSWFRPPHRSPANPPSPSPRTPARP